MSKVYFPNINGIRFIAALLVIIHHVEQVKSIFGYQSYWFNPFVNVVGKLGVVLFFVLSGFLITYLLLVEEHETKTISLKAFYIRRILRIWPVYYLVVLLSFFVFPYIPFLNMPQNSSYIYAHFWIKLVMFLFLLPNLALVVFPFVPYASQSWSVGVEEQFYLIWPFIMKNFKDKWTVLFLIIIGYHVGWFALQAISSAYNNKYLNLAFSLWNTINIDCMAIGGLFALILFESRSIKDIIYNPFFQLILVIILTSLISLGIKFPYFHYQLYAILFGMLILNISSNPKSVINLEYKVLNYLGKISYGLYMYHVLAIVITLKGLSTLGISYFIVQYITILVLTVLFATISYEYLEKPFVSKKHKFSIIKSGNDGKNG